MAAAAAAPTVAPPTNSMVCHCATCRRAAGAPVVAWVTFARDALRFAGAEPASFRSSAHVTRTFCPACGRPLTYVHDGQPGEIDVTTCSLDAPEAWPPTHHAWLDHDLKWVRFDDGLPTFPRARPDA